MSGSLKHWGIPGMHWGIRNEKPSTGRTAGGATDGSSSKGGGSSGVSPAKGAKAITPSADQAKMVELKHKKLEEMSNTELQHIANRMDLVNRYKNLNPSKVDKGKALVKSAFTSMASFTAAVGTITLAATAAMKVYNFATHTAASLPLPADVLAKRLASI